MLIQGYHVNAVFSPSVPIEGEFRVSSNDFNISKSIELTLDFSLLVNFDTIGVFLTLPQGVTLLEGITNQKFNHLEKSKNPTLEG